MRLHSNPASPFGRKVKVTAHELGLLARIEVIDLAVTPVSPSEALVAANPLSKIPCLVTDDGLALYDSRVICEHLDSLHDGEPLFPQAGTRRWRALTLQALGDGIMDAALLARYEGLIRPEPLRWAEWVENQKLKVSRGLDRLEAEAGGLAQHPDIGLITLGCALGYLDFRFAQDPWRDARPNLAAWFETFAARPSMLASRPR